VTDGQTDRNAADNTTRSIAARCNKVDPNYDLVFSSEDPKYRRSCPKDSSSTWEHLAANDRVRLIRNECNRSVLLVSPAGIATDSTPAVISATATHTKEIL